MKASRERFVAGAYPSASGDTVIESVPDMEAFLTDRPAMPRPSPANTSRSTVRPSSGVGARLWSHAPWRLPGRSERRSSLKRKNTSPSPLSHNLKPRLVEQWRKWGVAKRAYPWLPSTWPAPTPPLSSAPRTDREVGQEARDVIPGVRPGHLAGRSQAFVARYRRRNQGRGRAFKRRPNWAGADQP